MAAGDFDPSKDSVRVDEIAVVLYPGTAVVQKVRRKYAIVFPSGATLSLTVEANPQPETVAAIQTGATAEVAAILASEGLTTIWAPTSPAPLPANLTVAPARHAQTSDSLDLI